MELKKVAFSDGQEATNDFKVIFKNLNHRLFDFIEIEFLSGQEAENKLAVACKGAISTSTTSHYTLVQSSKMR